MTKKQWAQKRNFSKYRLNSVRSTLSGMLKSGVVTPNEKQIISDTLAHMRILLYNWDQDNHTPRKISCGE